MASASREEEQDKYVNANVMYITTKRVRYYCPFPRHGGMIGNRTTVMAMFGGISEET